MQENEEGENDLKEKQNALLRRGICWRIMKMLCELLLP
jgi:hypothetical protein